MGDRSTGHWGRHLQYMAHSVEPVNLSLSVLPQTRGIVTINLILKIFQGKGLHQLKADKAVKVRVDYSTMSFLSKK